MRAPCDPTLILRFVVDQRLTSNSGIRARNGSINGKDANAGIIAPVPVGQRNSRKSPLRHPMRGATLRRFVYELQFALRGHTRDRNVLANSPKGRFHDPISEIVQNNRRADRLR